MVQWGGRYSPAPRTRKEWCITIVNMFDKLSLIEKLEFQIRKEFEPKAASVSEIAQNCLDCYDYDLESTNRNYFSVDGNRFADIIEYVRFYGGFELFDFVV